MRSRAMARCILSLFLAVSCAIGLVAPFEESPGCLDGPLYEPGQVRVFLTLSPLARTLEDDTIEQRQIVLNWFNGDTYSSDWIGLFEHDPLNNPTLPLVRVSPVGYPSGSFKTDIQFGRPDLRTTNQSSSLGYWIGYIRNGATIASNSIKSQFNWMWDNREILGNLPITKMFLPGTHNSGSYRSYEGHASDTVFMRYLICHDEDIWHQLGYGIRYLDIRVGYYPDQEEKFWMNHNYARINPLSDLIRDIKQFLQVTREIIVLDFHRYPVGFNRNAHRKHAQLVSAIERELGQYMAPASLIYNATLNTLWTADKRLIVAYADDHTKAFHPLLWPKIPQDWGDKRTVADLFTYLSAVVHRRHNYHYFWTAMAELTPSTFDVIFRPGDGLRKLANTSNGNVTTWYRDLWWARSNSVAVDFFHSTDIVDTAVNANLKKSRCLAYVQQPNVPRSSAGAGLESQQQVQAMVSATPVYHGPRSINLGTRGNGPRVTKNRRRQNQPASTS